MSGDLVPPAPGEFLLYQSEDGRSRLEIRFDGETLWLTQAQMAELFQSTVPNINAHLRAVIRAAEVDHAATIKPYLIVRSEGGRTTSRTVLHYALPAILAVGMRVRSARGTQFRQWAIARLDEYLRKGFVMDDERLRNPPGAGVPDYFDELLDRIRDIRASERRVYLRIRDILALAADYAHSADDTARVFQTVQNKLHFAVTGLTAPEIIARRVNADAPNMGLTAWKGVQVRRGDVTVAKNYLLEPEITELNRIVTMFLDFAEDQASRRKQIFLRDWEQKLDDFLRFNERAVLTDGGTVSRVEADQRAAAAYDVFDARRRAELEAAAERDTMAELERTAKALPKRAKKRDASEGES
ncbi:MAG: virulence RhuM family protein [Pseudomonadota bacterium]|uniref:virulence RhuM family protein n=1 Tax=Gemmatimonas sp. TaxID=1962908 RepID=UPI0022CA1696|nr:virulence RhuM family protein [Gemmatimonas sp.]MCZ8010445.1 virulence RhuM family protein [Gemmatimonas sp.]MCZ8267008.1 virulence RhuM family protein [Gemmatimonas sp.]